MKLKQIVLNKFKRFHELKVDDLPESARLIVLTGPNGSGKSSLFDAFMYWYRSECLKTIHTDALYFIKQGESLEVIKNADIKNPKDIQLDFHESIPSDPEEKRRFFISVLPTAINQTSLLQV
jgi:AAA15 family ATPase/GTPase